MPDTPLRRWIASQVEDERGETTDHPYANTITLMLRTFIGPELCRFEQRLLLQGLGVRKECNSTSGRRDYIRVNRGEGRRRKGERQSNPRMRQRCCNTQGKNNHPDPTVGVDYTAL
eukprot:9187514-Pyramimonas_sp.AAC.1